MKLKHPTRNSFRNSDKPWCIEYCIITHLRPRDYRFPIEFHYRSSYKTFASVVNAYVDLQNGKLRLNTYMSTYYRIANVDFTDYVPFGN